MAPKPGKDELRADDNWGVGQNADGEINVIAPEDFAAALAQRQADDEAFGALTDDEADGTGE